MEVGLIMLVPCWEIDKDKVVIVDTDFMLKYGIGNAAYLVQQEGLRGVSCRGTDSYCFATGVLSDGVACNFYINSFNNINIKAGTDKKSDNILLITEEFLKSGGKVKRPLGEVQKKLYEDIKILLYKARSLGSDKIYVYDAIGSLVEKYSKQYSDKEITESGAWGVLQDGTLVQQSPAIIYRHVKKSIYKDVLKAKKDFAAYFFSHETKIVEDYDFDAYTYVAVPDEIYVSRLESDSYGLEIINVDKYYGAEDFCKMYLMPVGGVPRSDLKIIDISPVSLDKRLF